MSLRPAYPETVPGQGFVFVHAPTHSYFQAHTMSNLWNKVSAFANANSIVITNDEFDDNVCRNTPNIVCTEGIRGLGDMVHVVLNQIAKIVDAVAGTNMQGCGGCRDRQNALNNL